MATRTDLIASLALPPQGILWGELQETVRSVTLQSFMAANPAPYLLQVQEESLPKGLQARLSSLHDSDLSASRVHHLIHGDGPLLVGRSAVCDVVLDERTISKRHADLIASPHGWRVTDLEAANGTWVEEKRVRVGVPTHVGWGDMLRFSTYRGLLLPPQSLFALAVGMDPHGHSIRAGIGEIGARGVPLRELLVRVGRLDRSEFAKHCAAAFLLQVPVETQMDEEVLSEDLPPGATRAISRSRILRLKRGKKVGMAWVHLIWPRSGGEVLGRGPREEGIAIADETASKQHAKLFQKDGRWQVTDLGSRNGSYVEGKRLEAGLAHPLRHGQTLSFSSYRALFLGPEQILNLVDRMTRRL